MAKSKAERTRIAIINPAPGAHTQTTLAHARRYVKRGIAEFAGVGQLRFLRHEPSMGTASLHHSPTPMPVAPLLGDARVDMPVLPPYAEWLDRMGYDIYQRPCNGMS